MGYSAQRARSIQADWQEQAREARAEVSKHFSDMDFDNAAEQKKIEQRVDEIQQLLKRLAANLGDAGFRE